MACQLGFAVVVVRGAQTAFLAGAVGLADPKGYESKIESASN